MKRFILVFFVLTIALPLFAQRHIIDDAGVLNSADAAALERMAEEIARTYNFDLAIVTKTDIGEADPASYADELYNDMGFGNDGVLFLRVTGTRDYYFSTTGRGIKLLDQNPYAFDKLVNDVLRHLDWNNYSEGFRAFFSVMNEFLSLEARGRNYNFFHQWNIVIMIVVWAFAVAIGFMCVSMLKKQMNTALPQQDAAGFIVSGSLAFTSKNDRFLYSSVKKIKRQNNNSSLAKAAGGAIRTSSSGRRHGGRGGRR